jgi:peptidoglycan/LPS O-acetylase OafA/YrhL
VESWYLGVDMQLFLVSPLLIYPLWRWKKVGLIWLAFVTLALLVTNVVIHIVYYLGPYIPTRSIPPILGSQPMNALHLTRADQRTRWSFAYFDEIIQLNFNWSRLP